MIHTYQRQTRWLPLGVAAITAHVAFLLLILRVEPEYIPKPAPFIVLDYITLPPPPKPPPAKPQPVVKPPEPVQELVPDPVPEPAPEPEPVAESAPEPKAVTAVQEASPQPAASFMPAIVSDLSVLDNINFGPIRNPHPVYPPLARAAGLEGAVTVELLVGADGRVKSFSILKTQGHQQFALSTSKAVRHWRFPPPRVRGQETMVKYVYTVRFQLE